MLFSERNLHLRAFSNWLPRYIMVHIWWHQCYCILYRCLLVNLQESLPPSIMQQLEPNFVLECRAKCVQHACAVADMFLLVQKSDVDVNLDVEIAQCAYQVVRILLHSRERASLTTDQVMERVASCVLLTKQLARRYETVLPIVFFPFPSLTIHTLTVTQSTDLEQLILKEKDSITSEEVPDLAGERSGSHNTHPLSIIPATHQIISKHSPLDQSNFEDDSVTLDMPSEVPPGRQSSSTGTMSSETQPSSGLTHTRPPDDSVESNCDPRAPSTIQEYDVNLESQGEDWWDQNNAFQGAWDEASLSQMLDPYWSLTDPIQFPL